jgi:hypothetical protein
MLDYALYGMKVSKPNSIVATGGRFSYPDGARETPDTLNVGYEFDDFSINWEHSVNLGVGPEKLSHGVIFQGLNGSLMVNRNGWQVGAEKLNADEFKIEPVPTQVRTSSGFDEHFINFLDAIRSGSKPNCPVETGRDVAVVAHMGNIAYRTGEKLIWDKNLNEFSNSNAANSLLAPEYRAPWKLPQV